MGFAFRVLLLVVQFSDEAECDKLGLPLEVEELVVFLVLGHFNVPFRKIPSTQTVMSEISKTVIVKFKTD